jgi:hypothetical protein
LRMLPVRLFINCIINICGEPVCSRFASSIICMFMSAISQQGIVS